LLLGEIIGYNGDIITLQEVDREVFLRDLKPILDSFGMSGMFKNKVDVDEGLATFYRRDKFKQISYSWRCLSDALNEDEDFEYILKKVKANPDLFFSLTIQNKIVTVLVLQHIATGNLLIVGNTHLYHKATANHIKLLQTEICRKILEQKRMDIEKDYPKNKVAVMFNGDFNSKHDSAVVEYLNSGFIGSDHSDWRSEEGEEVEGLELKHEPIFFSAAGMPKYTNYTLDFKDCLDYCWIEKSKMEVTQVVPLPSEEELSQFEALPNIEFPSDHVALVFDVKFL